MSRDEALHDAFQLLAACLESVELAAVCLESVELAPKARRTRPWPHTSRCRRVSDRAQRENRRLTRAAGNSNDTCSPRHVPCTMCTGGSCRTLSCGACILTVMVRKACMTIFDKPGALPVQLSACRRLFFMGGPRCSTLLPSELYCSWSSGMRGSKYGEYAPNGGGSDAVVGRYS